MSGYVIKVGHHAPQPVIIGFPDKNTGMPVGEFFETVRQNGAVQIINRARVWCRRVMPDGKLPADTSIEANDPKYKGTLEFLDWQDNKTGAQAIEIRFLTMSSSLDYDYQRTVQKIETKVEDGTDFLYFNPGENKYDPKTEALYIQFLKVHPQNRDSKSKNPDPKIKGYSFYEVNDDNSDRTSIHTKEISLDAGILVRGLSSKNNQLRNLFDILKQQITNINELPVFSNISHLSTETDIYRALLMYTETEPDQLLLHVDRYKKELLEKFEWAKSHDALDITKDGFIALLIDGKPNILWKEVPEKGKKMLDWVIDNFVEEEVYIQSRNFKKLCEKLK
jgi:hypothetical protein